MREQTLYTDGACPGNGTEEAEGGIGWARTDGETRSIYWCDWLTKRYGPPTNQKCELMAVAFAVFGAGAEAMTIKGTMNVKNGEILTLKHVKRDSKYVVDGINHWLRNWKANDWKNSKKKPVSNMQMWKDLDSVLSYGHLRGCFTFSYIPGHSGDPGNDLADEAARNAVEDGEIVPEAGWKELELLLEEAKQGDPWLDDPSSLSWVEELDKALLGDETPER